MSKIKEYHDENCTGCSSCEPCPQEADALETLLLLVKAGKLTVFNRETSCLDDVTSICMNGPAIQLNVNE